MAKLDTLFSRYDKLVIFDTETTGLSPNRDEIIEFSAAVLERQNGEAVRAGGGITGYHRAIRRKWAVLAGGLYHLKFRPSPASPIKTYGSGASPKPVCAGTWRS